MPLLLLSGILLPMALAPDWLQFLSTLSPLTHAVDAARALFNGHWGDPEIPIGVGLMAASRSCPSPSPRERSAAPASAGAFSRADHCAGRGSLGPGPRTGSGT